MEKYDPSVNFIKENEIWQTLKKHTQPSHKETEKVLAKGREKKGLTLDETAILLQTDEKELVEQIYETARYIKNELYGNRIVFFAPLYVTNECGNICNYCGFKADNKDLYRKTLSKEELAEEVKILENWGHKRLLLVYGEHPKFGADWIVETINTVYQTKSEKSGEIRRVNINCAPLDVEGFRKIKAAGIGTYQCFQETYHWDTYHNVHLSGKKRDYLWRLYSLHRAQEAGLDDVAMGVLFGLFDHKFEVLALLQHAQELERVFNVGPHTISFPRIEPALGAPLSENPPYQMSEQEFKKVVAILRIAVPYTGLILTTRETAKFRRELLKVGVSQISAGSRTYPGGYSDLKANLPDKQQFTIGDTRSLDEVIIDLAQNGYIVSFCTSCYRLGRTGEHFMELVKPGFIQKFCIPNALITFKEYLLDYASPQAKEIGEKLIQAEIEKLPTSEQREFVLKKLQELENGKRDICF
jgi:2-iminoacetate synthase